jgi:hypothetical protein
MPNAFWRCWVRSGLSQHSVQRPASAIIRAFIMARAFSGSHSPLASFRRIWLTTR